MPGEWAEEALRALRSDHANILAAVGATPLAYGVEWPEEAGHLYFVEDPGRWTNFVCRSESLGDEIVVSFFGGTRYRRQDFEGRWRFALIPDFYRPTGAGTNATAPGVVVDHDSSQ